jgi:hypothetical protein
MHMRKLLFTMALAAMTAPTLAGNSDHGGYEPGDSTRVRRAPAADRPGSPVSRGAASAERRAPYALTGDTGQRVLEWRDVPAGRGQTQRLPFWVER